MGCSHTDLPRILAIVQMPSVFPNTFEGQKSCTEFVFGCLVWSFRLQVGTVGGRVGHERVDFHSRGQPCPFPLICLKANRQTAFLHGTTSGLKESLLPTCQFSEKYSTVGVRVPLQWGEQPTFSAQGAAKRELLGRSELDIYIAVSEAEHFFRLFQEWKKLNLSHKLWGSPWPSKGIPLHRAKWIRLVYLLAPQKPMVLLSDIVPTVAKHSRGLVPGRRVCVAWLGDLMIWRQHICDISKICHARLEVLEGRNFANFSGLLGHAVLGGKMIQWIPWWSQGLTDNFM